MGCNNPIRAYYGRRVNPETGKRPVSFRRPEALDGSMQIDLPCGNCNGCRKKRSTEWGIRCYHESQLHENSLFLTLSYDRKNLPSDYMLNHRHFQLFMKKLRKRESGKRFPKPLRYLMCGEYGEKTYRCHYHAIIFGLEETDLAYYKDGKNGDPIYRSEKIEQLWGRGEVPIGSVTLASCIYVAKYINKTKLMTNKLMKHEGFVKPYNASSRRPGIGMPYLYKNWQDFYPRGYCIVDGKKYMLPRAYDKWVQENHPKEFKEVKRIRAMERHNKVKDLTLSELDKRGHARDTIQSGLTTPRDSI